MSWRTLIALLALALLPAALPASTEAGPSDPYAVDSDGDGRADSEDRCPGAAAPDHRGCPLFERRISIHRHGATFTGHVRSDEPRCVRAAVARIDRLRDGEHRVIEVDEHLDDGRYSMRVNLTLGRYTATVGRNVLRNTGICPFAASRTIVIDRG